MADEVTIEDDGPLLLIGVNRPDAHNLWTSRWSRGCAERVSALADAEHLRVGVSAFLERRTPEFEGRW